MSHHVPLNELAVAVQNAVEQALGKHGDVPIDKLWVGFVAPENLATQEFASKVATQLSKEAGVHAQASVAQQVPAVKEHAAKPEAFHPPGHIIGLVFQPKAVQK